MLIKKKKKNTRTILKYFSNFQILKKLPSFQIVTRKNPSISKRFPELPKSHKNISLPKDSLEQPYIPLQDSFIFTPFLCHNHSLINLRVTPTRKKEEQNFLRLVNHKQRRVTCFPSQVTYGPRGNTTTTVLQHSGNNRKPLGITRATSIRRRGPANRQQLLGVLAVTLLATCLFILLLLALNTNRECVQEPRKLNQP